MTAEQLQDPRWLAANADHDRPFEVACAQAIEKLLTEKPGSELTTMKIKIQKLHPDVILPQYATAGAACFDLHAATVCEKPWVGATVEHGRPVVCGTGLAFEIPAGHVMLAFSRSGHGFKSDIRLANCVAVVDSDFRGEVKIKLTKDHHQDDVGQLAPIVTTGDRIAQAMILPIPSIEFEEVDQLAPTARGAGGFGSTGVA